jgi:hypothetical protein
LSQGQKLYSLRQKPQEIIFFQNSNAQAIELVATLRIFLEPMAAVINELNITETLKAITEK